MNRHRVCLMLLWAVTATPAGGLAGDTAASSVTLDAAVRTYDLPAVTVVLAHIRDAMARHPDRDLEMLHLRASLALAELLRIEWEETPDVETCRRRELGGRIDAVAREGLVVADQLPESSERERMRADLVATMIRSDFRAKKFEARFRAAVERSLELDEGNARAWVTSAKPLLFASPEHGGNLTEAVRMLNRASELDPDLESALLLRALAYERLNELENAFVDLTAVLARNPDCGPARRALDRIVED